MWRLPTKIFFRESGLLTLPELIQSSILPKSPSSILIVTDRGFNSSTSWIDQCSYSLQSTLGCNIKIYDSTPVNPRIETVEEITNMSIENKCDLIIGIGGGSSIDAAKCASMYSSPINNKQSLSSYIGKPNLFSNDGILPFIAIPSTCGTGSEVTWVSVLTNDKIKRKISIKGDKMFPTAAIIDCDLLKTLPKELIAWTSFDALTHALEALTTNENVNNDISNLFATKAINLIFEYLPRAVNKIKQDRFARYYISQASTFAGLAFGNSDVAAVHCLSETLGGLYDIPHGLANSAILYQTIKYHQPFIKEKLCKLCNDIQIEKKMVYQMLIEEIDGGQDTLKKMNKDDLFLLCLDRLRSEIGIVLKSFNQLNVKQSDYKYIAKECVINGSNESNPQTMNEDNYLKLLEMLENDKIKYIKNPCLAHDH